MEYGRIPKKELEIVDTSLPPDSGFNNLVLTGKTGHTKVYMGTPKWGKKEWIGKLYPKGTKDAQFLGNYVENYNAIELNSTHYKLYQSEDIDKWVLKAKGRNFKFCPKVWNQISHYSGFNNTKSFTAEFLKSVLVFKDHLGPIFLQLSEHYSAKQANKLYDYLSSLPKDLQFFIEVRHTDWYTGYRQELFDTLRRLKIGAVITDTLAHREVIHMELTIPKAFIRFMCQGDHHSDISRIDDWVKRIKEWQDKGLQECYFFVHVLKDAFSPEITKYIAEQFNKVCNSNLPEIKFTDNKLF